MPSLNYSKSKLSKPPVTDDENQSNKLIKNAIKRILKIISKSLKPLTSKNPQSE